MLNSHRIRMSSSGGTINRLLACAVAVCFCLPLNVAAIDCNAGPHLVRFGPFGYWEYVPNPLVYTYGDSSCWSVDNMQPTYMSCYGWPAWEIGGGFSSWMSWSHTVTASDPGGPNWYATIFYDFDDPNNSFYNQLSVTVLIWRNGSLLQQIPLVDMIGSSGADAFCERADTSAFIVGVGDTVEILISGSRLYENTHMRVTYVSLQRI